jgi:hypothetical protein
MTDTPRRARSTRREEAWQLTKNGRTMACLVRRDERPGGKWVVILSLDGEWQLGCRCATKAEATFTAETLQQDHLRAGWTT